MIWGRAAGEFAPPEIGRIDQFGFADIAAALAKAAESAGRRPPALEVWDAALAEYLQGLLAPLGIAVSVAPRPAWIGQLVDTLTSQLQQFRSAELPPALVHGDVTIEMARAFAGIAADYFRAAPWKVLSSDDDLLEILFPKPPKPMRFCCVLGHGGQEFGLGFYDSARTFQKLSTDAALDPEFLVKHRFWSVTFSMAEEVPPNEAALWIGQQLEMPRKNLLPLVIGYGPGDKIARPDAAELAFISAVLGAITKSTLADFDKQRWDKTVNFLGQQIPVALGLVELPSRRAKDAPPASARLEMEQMLKGFTEALKRGEVSEDAEGLMSWDEPSPRKRRSAAPATPQQQAEELVIEATNFVGLKRTRLARKALEVWPDCADAYSLLGNHTGDPAEAAGHFRLGLAAAERALPPEAFKEWTGHFWGVVDTRPYMRARRGLAETLWKLGQRHEALDHTRELLRLNPNDNQGTRYLLAGWLLELGNDQEAAALFDRYPDEGSTHWYYSKALLAFRLHGDSAPARTAFRMAFRSNRYVPKFLAIDPSELPAAPDFYSFGDQREAIIYTHECRQAWKAAPGALEWMAATAGSTAKGTKRTATRRKRGK